MTTTARITRHNIEADNGQTVAVFFNHETSLLVVDIIDADDEGGTEIVRRTLAAVDG